MNNNKINKSKAATLAIYKEMLDKEADVDEMVLDGFYLTLLMKAINGDC